MINLSLILKQLNGKKNDWFQKDRVKTYTAMGIHEDLINEGFDGQ
jgi:hypothetical protein